MLFAGLLTAHGTVGPAEVAAKRAYTMRDVMRTAARRGIAFEGPPAHPFNPLRALRMCIALDDAAPRRRFGLALMDAAWSLGLDLTDEAVLMRVAADCGLDGARLFERAALPEIKQRLQHATQAAIDEGVFGVPTFRYARELFWGSDRIDALLWRLQGNAIDEDRLRRLLARPAAAQRRPGAGPDAAAGPAGKR